MLKIESLNVKYGDIQTLWDVSLEVNDGEIVAQAEHTVIVNEDGCEVITRLAK